MASTGRARPQGSYARLEEHDTTVSRLAQQDKIPWYSKSNLRLLYLLMIPTCIGVEVTSGFDASMINGLQTVSSWLEYFDHPHSASLGLMASMYSLGCVAGVPITPSLVDKMGRRYPILLAGILSIFGGILQGYSLNFMMFIIARFILGFANCFCVVAASSLIGELSHPKERATISGLFNASYTLGSLAAAGVTLRTFAMKSNWGWRIPSLFQILPSLLQVLFIWFIPESPRWLLSKGRHHEAFDILVKYHAEGNHDSEFAEAEYRQMVQALEAELKTDLANKMFSIPGMRKRVIVTVFLGLFINFSGIGLISHFISLILSGIGIDDDRTKNIINFSLASWGVINATILSFVAHRYPRRKIYLVSSISLFVVFTAWTVACANYSLTHSIVSARVALALVFLYRPAYSLGFTILTFTFLVELFPFHARARGITIYQWWSRIAAFVCDFVNPIGIDSAGWRWYIVYCVWNAFQVVFIYIMFPETSGRTLEELTFLYEEDREALGWNSEVEGFSGLSTAAEGYGTMGEQSEATIRDDGG